MSVTAALATSAYKVLDMGVAPVTTWADPVTKKVINFVANKNQDASSGYVHADASDHDKRQIAAAREPSHKPTRHYDALKKFSPEAKPGQKTALGMQTQGMQHQDKLMQRAAGRRYDALRAAPSQPKVSPKPQPAPAPMPQSKVISVNEIGALSPEQMSERNGLKLVSSNKTPTKQSTLQQRMNYWSRGMACNIG